jgi:hypothetical protein
MAGIADCRLPIVDCPFSHRGGLMDIGRSCHTTFSIDPPRRGNQQSATETWSNEANL